MLGRRAGRLNFSKHAADGIDSRQKGAGNVGVAQQQPVSHLTQQIFANVRDRLQLCKPKKATGSLQRVDRSEDAAQCVPVTGVFFNGTRSRSSRSRFS